MHQVPEPIANALPDDAEERLGARLAVDGAGCEGSVHHSPRPLTLILVDLGHRHALLCPTCAANLRVLDLVQAQGAGWPVMRSFSRPLRMLRADPAVEQVHHAAHHAGAGQG